MGSYQQTGEISTSCHKMFWPQTFILLVLLVDCEALGDGDYLNYNYEYLDDGNVNFPLLAEEILTERQSLITSSLSLGLLLSAFGAAIVGSLIAVGLSRFVDVSVDIHATVADINGPLAGLQEDYEDETEVEMEEAEEEERDEK